MDGRRRDKVRVSIIVREERELMRERKRGALV